VAKSASIPFEANKSKKNLLTNSVASSICVFKTASSKEALHSVNALELQIEKLPTEDQQDHQLLQDGVFSRSQIFSSAINVGCHEDCEVRAFQHFSASYCRLLLVVSVAALWLHMVAACLRLTRMT
jgi:hypothetical protein